MSRCETLNRDRLGFCHSCGARNGEPHHHEPEQADPFAHLAHRFVIVDGYWIQPHMLDANSYTRPGRVVCTNGKTITHQEGAR